MNPKDFKFFYKENNFEFEKSKMFQFIEKATKENLEFCKALDDIIITSVEKMLNEKLKE